MAKHIIRATAKVWIAASINWKLILIMIRFLANEHRLIAVNGMMFLVGFKMSLLHFMLRKNLYTVITTILHVSSTKCVCYALLFLVVGSREDE